MQNDKFSWQILVRGVRGSTPISNSNMLKYGGSTTCFELRCGAVDLSDDFLGRGGRPCPPNLQEVIILDAGTGIVPLGRELIDAGQMQGLGQVAGQALPKIDNPPFTAHIFISHAHLDHVQGLPFFAPIFSPLWNIRIYIPKEDRLPHVPHLPHLIDRLFDGQFFPLTLKQLASKISIIPYTDNDQFSFSQASLTCPKVPHTSLCHAFSFKTAQKQVFFATDIEIPPAPSDDYSRMLKLIQGADIAILGTQYTFEEYGRFKGWGHSACEVIFSLSAQAGVKHLVCTHYAPSRTDLELDKLDAKCNVLSMKPSKASFAKEGDIYTI